MSTASESTPRPPRINLPPYIEPSRFKSARNFIYYWIILTTANVTGTIVFVIFMAFKLPYRKLVYPFMLASIDPLTYHNMAMRCLYIAKSVAWIWYFSFVWWLSWIPLVNKLFILEPRQALKVRQLFGHLDKCTTWENYRETCYGLDEALNLLKWRDADGGPYNHALVKERLEKLRAAWASNNHQLILSIIRSHSRNFGHVASPKLYSVAFSGTKFIIEEYVCELARSIDRIVRSHRAGLDFPDGTKHRMPIQNLLDFVFNARQTIGRTALLLQGGATFGLIHVGVVRGLRKHGLLPRIIVGDSTGALIGALVCTHREDELHKILSGTGIDLRAFDGQAGVSPGKKQGGMFDTIYTLVRRIIRYLRVGNILDIQTIEECVQANVGDITFEEAYKKTKRILNIIIYRDEEEPLLLNYLNAPQVLVRTAAVASSSSSSPLIYGEPNQILFKTDNGQTIPWADTCPAALAPKKFRKRHPVRNEVLHRVRSQFHVNHFIISQARPSLAPFLQSDLHRPSHYQFSSILKSITGILLRWYMSELAHYVRQVNRLGLLPHRWARYIVTERIVGTHLTIVPEIKMWDFLHLLDYPTESRVEKWARLGEQATWPAIQALRIRCVVEIELDRAYHFVRTQAGRNLAKISSWARFPPIDPGRNKSITLMVRPTLVRYNSDPVPENRLQMTSNDNPSEKQKRPHLEESLFKPWEPNRASQARSSKSQESGAQLDVPVKTTEDIKKVLEEVPDVPVKATEDIKKALEEASEEAVPEVVPEVVAEVVAEVVPEEVSEEVQEVVQQEVPDVVQEEVAPKEAVEQSGPDQEDVEDPKGKRPDFTRPPLDIPPSEDNGQETKKGQEMKSPDE